MFIVTGNVLGVTSERVQPRPGSGATWEPFTRTSIHVLDGFAVQEVGTGNNFDLTTLREVKDGDQIAVEVEFFKGRVYAKSIIALGAAAARFMPQPAKAS